MVQVSTAYLASSRVRARSYTTSEPVIRGCTDQPWPLDQAEHRVFARRITSSGCCLGGSEQPRLRHPAQHRPSWPDARARSGSPRAAGELPDDRLNSGSSARASLVSRTRCRAVRLPGNVMSSHASALRLAAGRTVSPRPVTVKHAARVHPEPAFRVALGARVKHQRPGLEIARHDDRRAQLRPLGIPGRRSTVATAAREGRRVVSRGRQLPPAMSARLRVTPEHAGATPGPRVAETAVELEHGEVPSAGQANSPRTAHPGKGRPAPRARGSPARVPRAAPVRASPLVAMLTGQ